MEYTSSLREKIGFVLQVQPYQTVPFKTQAIRAESIFARSDTAIRKKSAEAFIADGTGNVRATVKYAKRL